MGGLAMRLNEPRPVPVPAVLHATIMEVCLTCELVLTEIEEIERS